MYKPRGRKEGSSIIHHIISPHHANFSFSLSVSSGTTRHLLPRTAPAWASGQSREALSRVVRLEMPVSGEFVG